jgi:hypothetical protein
LRLILQVSQIINIIVLKGILHVIKCKDTTFRKMTSETKKRCVAQNIVSNEKFETNTLFKIIQ